VRTVVLKKNFTQEKKRRTWGTWNYILAQRSGEGMQVCLAERPFFFIIGGRKTNTQAIGFAQITLRSTGRSK
jgi:hypothetical protein